MQITNNGQGFLSLPFKKGGGFMKEITVTFQLTEIEAEAFSQFLKRAYWDIYRKCAVSDDDAYNMIYAAGKVRAGLSEAGFNSR